MVIFALGYTFAIFFNDSYNLICIPLALAFFSAAGLCAKRCVQKYDKNNPQKSNFQYSTSSNESAQPPSISTNTINDLINNIDKALIPYLWFYDGKYKNITVQEPSAISLTFEIASCISTQELGYYPSYSQMSSEQRYIYLQWLSDITQPIQIGYVFVLYYGLERHLLFGDYLGASRIIKKLKQHHNNGSFKFYSDNALTICAIKHKEFSIIEDINIDDLKPDLSAMLKLALGEPFTSNDIIKFAKAVGFTNQRYIKNDYDLFNKILNEKINDSFTLTRHHVNDIKEDFPIVFANYNLSMDSRILSIPNILSSTSLKYELYTIINETHKVVKLQLREQRKKCSC